MKQKIGMKSRTFLSGREQEVLGLMSQGKTSWAIARILGISERTVNFHIYNIMLKLDVTRRSQAVSVAMERRLFDAGNGPINDLAGMR